MFEFANIWIFILLPLPLLIHWLVPAIKHKEEALRFPLFRRAAEASNQRPSKKAWVLRRTIFQWIFLLLAWIALLFSLAKPQLVGAPEMKVKTARNFVVAADISFSMAIRDWKVGDTIYTRWQGVRNVMSDFLNKRKGDKIGLVFFGTNAYLQSPLTTDLETINYLLNDADVGMAGQSTSIGKAIGYALKIFEGDTIEEKVLLLITDGKDSGEGISPLDAANLAKNDSITIYTIGIGNPENSDGSLDEKMLKNIAAQTGGAYFLAQDQEELEEAYKTLDRLEPIAYEEEIYKPITPLYFYPLSLFLLFSLLLLIIRIILKIVSR